MKDDFVDDEAAMKAMFELAKVKESGETQMNKFKYSFMTTSEALGAWE